jgi:hypothetical protein
MEVGISHSRREENTWMKAKRERNQRERAGLFLLMAKLTFKLSPCATHPLIKRPFHSFAYPCTLQNPGGWVGSFPIVVPWSNNQPIKAIVSSWYASKNINKHK